METSRIQFAYKAYRRPFRQPVRTSQGIWETREGIILRVETEEGEVAFGEIAPIERFGTETLTGALAWCVNLGARLERARFREVPRELPCCAAAASAVVADLASNKDEQPTPAAPAAQDGGQPTLRVACLLPTGTAAIDALRRSVDRGLVVFKTKIGAAQFDDELTLVRRLVESLPTGGRLRLDANGGLDAGAAARWLTAAADWPVEFLEQPLPMDGVEDLIKLAQDFPTAIALDESVRTADDIKRWRDRGWPGVFVIKPALAGDCDELLAELRIEPDRFVFSSALESRVGMKSGIQLAFAAGATRALGYGVDVFFPDDGLGGGWNRPELSASDMADMDLADVWNRL